MTKQEILGKYINDEYLLPGELDELGLEPVSESGVTCTTDEMREEGWIFRLASSEDADEVQGYVVESMDVMPAGSVLHSLAQV
jgi:hypothetical protein